MTSTPPEAPTSPSGQPGPTGGGPRVTREDIRNLDRLRRTTGANKYVAGVAGGVARHFDIDPAIVRVLFVVLTFFGGTGLMLYGALWLLLPEDDGDQAIINLDSRSLTFALLAVLVFGAVLLVGDSWGGYGFPWPLTVIGLVVAGVLLSRDRKNPPAPPPLSYTPYVPAAVPQRPLARRRPNGHTADTSTRLPTRLPRAAARLPAPAAAAHRCLAAAAGPTAAGQPAQARTHPVLVHDGAGRSRRRDPRRRRRQRRRRAVVGLPRAGARRDRPDAVGRRVLRSRRRGSSWSASWPRSPWPAAPSASASTAT